MKKKILFIFVILFIIISAVIIYLNKVILPTKIKSSIISGLQEATQQKVSLQEIEFNIFKGLVLKNLVVYDGTKTLLSIKECSCVFPILPIFKKKIVIPVIRLKSPVIFLERRVDSRFNIQDLFLKKAPAAPKPGAVSALPAKQGFSIFIYKVSIRSATVSFQDNALSPAFTKRIENLNLVLNLSVPDRIKFTLQAEIPASPVININTSGEYKIIDKELIGKIGIKDFSPQEFQPYYLSSGISILEGTISAAIDFNLKGGLITVKTTAQNKNLSISKDGLSFKANSQIEADLKYNLVNKQLEYSAVAAINKADITGLGILEKITDVNGEVKFNNSGVFADKLLANIWAIPVEAKLRLTDFKSPLLNIDLTSTLELNSILQLSKDKFKLGFPGTIQGKGNLFLKVETRLPAVTLPRISGSLDIVNAALDLQKVTAPLAKGQHTDIFGIEDINGRLEFEQNRLKWSKIKFKYSGLPYATSGILADFKTPSAQLELSSKDLSLDASFSIDQKLIKLSELRGQYLNSKFSITGDINTQEPSNLEVDVTGQLNIDLQDLKVPLEKFRGELERIKPEGIVSGQVKLKGNINELKSCVGTARLTSDSVSGYGLKAHDFFLNYSQQDGLIDIPRISLSLYDGIIEASAKMNLNSENPPFWFSTDIQGIRLEKLKMDTAASEKDIAGTVSFQAKINGFSKDISRLNGVGRINISEGRLWQLNLFKGLGQLLFVEDFAHIIFEEGSCDFSIQDKYFFTDNLRLKSNIAELGGAVKIGFDSSLDALLNVQVLDEKVPLSGTFKDFTQAIIGQAGRFGAIKISGTLKEPKYKFQTAVVDIIKSLKDTILGNIFKE